MINFIPGKSLTISLESKSNVRTKKELQRLLDYAISQEEYELCASIKEVIDNYEALIKDII